jgi:CheY-like chemotaxis protein
MTTILIAEDNEANRELLRELLELRGYGVLEAGDGVEAIRIATERSPDLILMDVQMPRLDGVAALAELRRIQQGRVPVLALTAFAMTGDRENLLAQGFDGYVSKPIEVDLLMTEIRKHLGDTQAAKKHA